MRKTYGLALVITGLLTAFFSLPNAASTILVLTLGIGLVFVLVAVNLFAVLLAFFPVAVAPERLRIPALVFSLLVLCGYLIGPAVLARIEVTTLQAELSGTDIPPQERPEGLRRFELVYDGISRSEFCPEPCQVLLLSGQASSVHVRDRDNSGFVFVRGTAQSCDESVFCVLAARAPVAPAEVRVTVSVLTTHLSRERMKHCISKWALLAEVS